MVITYEFVFCTIYKRPFPEILLRTLPVIIKKEYKDVFADINIKDIWIDNLLNIKNISLTSLFSGINRHFPTHIVFSVGKITNDKCLIINNKFNKNKSITSGYDNYDINKSFFCLTTRNWYRNETDSKQLFKWWENIPTIIMEGING